MASINGFKYEPWERTSSIARRDFRHSNDEMEPKYWKGSKRKKSSPNKKQGCPANDGNNHVYVVIQHKRKVLRKNNKSYEHVYHRKECIGCGKVGKHLWNYADEPYQVFESVLDLRYYSF